MRPEGESPGRSCLLRVDSITPRGREGRSEEVAVEYPFTIVVNGRELVTLLCTPDHLEALTLGFLHSEGFIEGPSDVTTLMVQEREGLARVGTARPVRLEEKLFGKRTVVTGCGRGSIFYQLTDSLKVAPVKSDIRVPRGTITEMMRKLQRGSPLYRATRGTHCAALGDGAGFWLLREDVGRHNAVDKVMGECLIHGIDTGNKVLLTTGRVSSDMLVKAARMKVALLVSRSTPTELAVKMATELGVSLVGFARGDSMKVYTYTDRVL